MGYHNNDEFDIVASASFWRSLVGTVIIAIVIVFTAAAIGLGIYKAFAVPYEDARRDAYEHTQSYVQGSIQDLNNLCLEIDRSDPSHKDLIRGTIRQRYVKLDPNDIPMYLRPCLNDARQMGGQ